MTEQHGYEPDDPRDQGRYFSADVNAGSRGGWNECFTGTRFYTFDPAPEDVRIDDIAHSLSLQCRYNGNTVRFYCPTPEQRVLTADLRWVSAGELREGDALVGFDENPVTGDSDNGIKRGRRMKPTHVTAAQAVRRQVYRVELSDGTVLRAAADHPWLVTVRTASHSRKWRTTQRMAQLVERQGEQMALMRFFKPWDEPETLADGWLAGMLDGEGCLSTTDGRFQVSVSQNEGPVLTMLRRMLESRAFDFSDTPSGDHAAHQLALKGGVAEQLRLLGSVRPMRLLASWRDRFGSLDLALPRDYALVNILAVVDEGEQWVMGLETDSRTYFCEGFGSHNSVAEHSCLLSDFVRSRGWHGIDGPPGDHEFRHDALIALLHDAAEAYIGDLIRPVKHRMPPFKELEGLIEAVVFPVYGLEPTLPQWMKNLDSRILCDERRQVMLTHHNEWSTDELEPLGVRIVGWQPARAEFEFLRRFHELHNGETLARARRQARRMTRGSRLWWR